MLILSWDALGWNPKKRAMHYEFSTSSMETAVSLEAQLDQLMQTMHETYEIENLFQDPKMELAVSLSKQANWLIGAVGLISFVLSLIILFLDSFFSWSSKTGSSYSSFVRVSLEWRCPLVL